MNLAQALTSGKKMKMPEWEEFLSYKEIGMITLVEAVSDHWQIDCSEDEKEETKFTVNREDILRIAKRLSKRDTRLNSDSIEAIIVSELLG